MNFVKFRISGQNIDLERISKTLNIVPDYSYKKGDTNYDIFKQAITYIEDCWIAGIKIENENETEEKISEFVSLFYENKSFVQQLSKMHCITLWITLHPDIQFNLHFSKKVLDMISELGIDMDITCMQLQEFYSGSYLPSSTD